jgi:hypothetical protein
MKYGELGRSGMKVSKICLGTMHFGPKAVEEEARAILDKFVDVVDLRDKGPQAPGYRPGSFSEANSW